MTDRGGASASGDAVDSAAATPGVSTTTASSTTTTTATSTTAATVPAIPASSAASPGAKPLSNGATNSASAITTSGSAAPPSSVTTPNIASGNLAPARPAPSGVDATGAQQGAFQMTTAFLGLMLDPFADGRGSAGADTASLGLAWDREELPPEIAQAYAAVFKAPVAKPVAFEPRWSLWGGAYGGISHTADHAATNTSGLTTYVSGFAAGADDRLSETTTIGFALAGGGTGWSFADGLGGGISNAIQAGVFGETRIGPIDLAASVATAAHWVATNRISFDTLTARFDAQSFGGRLEAGCRAGAWATPYIAVQAQAFVTPAYGELDPSGGGLGLVHAGRTATDTRDEFGSRFARAIALDPTTLLTLHGKLAWAHDWMTMPSLVVAFQAQPGTSFVVHGAAPPIDSALIATGAELRFASGWSLVGKFDGEIALRAQTYAGAGTLRYSW